MGLNEIESLDVIRNQRRVAERPRIQKESSLLASSSMIVVYEVPRKENNKCRQTHRQKEAPSVLDEAWVSRSKQYRP